MASKKNGKKTAPKKAPKISKKKVSAIPEGYSAVTPYLNLSDAKAMIAFCKKSFGAKLRGGIMATPDGKVMHAEIEIDGAPVMMSDSINEPARASSIMLYVKNVDKTVAKAVQNGATITMPIETMFWGDRFGRITDPQGNNWSIATHVEDVPPAEMKKRVKASMQPAKA